MLDALFRPKTVAVIGASSKALSIGNRVIRNLIDFDFRGEIYPINPKADEIRGIKAYPSILDVPAEQIDVVHMVIPARFVPQAVDDCAVKKVKHIIINSGGFAEIGPEGEAIQEDFLARARKHGIRIFGPNCQGIINSDPEIRAYCNFTFTKPDPGYISILALSGGVAEVIHQEFSVMGIGTRIYASNGNACDVTIPEILRYLGEDEGTRVIVTYVEGLRDAATFMEVAREVAAKKPVLAMKAGRTAEGAKAAASHTGGLAKEDIATDLIFKKAGILSFGDEGELIQAAAAFATQPLPKGNRVGIITNTGGPAVIATDVMVGAGLELPPLSAQTEERLKAELYPEASVSNPVDVLATGNAAHYRACLEAMLADDAFDSIYVNFVTPFFVDTDSIAKEIVEVARRQEKPIVCNLMTDRRQWTETVRILKEGGVPCFSLPGVAARSLAAMARYNQIKSRPAGTLRTFTGIDGKAAADVVEAARSAGRSVLTAAEVYGILDAYGFPTTPWKVAGDAAGAVAAADELGYPVVVKADAVSILHKSDQGGVAVNLADADAVRKTVEEMRGRLDAPDLKFLVQQFVPGGLEVICGAKAEPGLGHMVMFGMGGIYVEVLKDVVFELCPVTDSEAGAMLDEIRLAPLLSGVRGQTGVDRDALTDVLQRLSKLLTDLPAIQELDLNPVLAMSDGARIVDARMTI